MKLFKNFTLGFIPLFLFSIFVVPASSIALTFDPSFGVTLSDNSAGANSAITLLVTQPAGDELTSTLAFSAPVGWDFASGSIIDQDAVVGSGTFQAILNGGQITSPVVIRNDQDLQGHKAHWKVVFAEGSAGEVTLHSFLDGSSASGHSFTLSRPNPTNFSFETPASLEFSFLGTVNGSPVITNPTVQGDYSWQVELTSPTGVVVTRSQTLSIPGSATPVGSDVTAFFNNGSSVTFSSVSTGGTTTLATSTTPPPTGSGQFQLSGGLYYDFNTTATFSCPCTITLPYDPNTTPNPRIYHQEDSVWVDVTTNVDTVNNLVTGVVSSFSFFAAGEPTFGLEFMDPVAAMLQESDPISVSANRTLPVNFTLGDENGDFVVRTDVSVQVIDTSNNYLKGEIPAEALKKHYKANLSIKDLNLDVSKTYRMRVKIGNTTYSPTLLFSIK